MTAPVDAESAAIMRDLQLVAEGCAASGCTFTGWKLIDGVLHVSVRARAYPEFVQIELGFAKRDPGEGKP